MKTSCQVVLYTVLLIAASSGASAAQGGDPLRARDGHDPFVTMDQARDIMPRGSFFGQNEIEHIFRVRFTASEKEQFYRLPFRESTLRRCNGCVLFLVTHRFGRNDRPTDIDSLLKSFEFGQQFNESRIAPWFKDEAFAKRSVGLGWHLVRINLDGKGRKLADQEYRLSAKERLAPADLYVYLLLLSPRHLAEEYTFTSDKAHREKSTVIVGRRGGRINIEGLAARFIVRPNLGMAVEVVPDR